MNTDAAMALPQKALLMVVDDDELFRESVVQTLNDRGFRVNAYPDGEKAWEALHRGERPDAIILDLRMPGLDGREFRRKQLHAQAFASIPVVAVSGHGSQHSEVPVEVLLTRPLASDALLKAVDLVLQPKMRRRRRLTLRHAKPDRHQGHRAQASADAHMHSLLSERRERMLLNHVSLGISHVVNNTLQGLLSYVQAFGDKEEDLQAHRAVTDAALRCADTIRTFADCARIRSFEVQPAEEREWANHVLLDAWRQLCPARIELRVTGPHLLDHAQLSPNDVLALTSELILNSVEAIGPADGKIHVRIALRRRKLASLMRAWPAQNRRGATWCCLEVIDSGPGIASSDLELIWMPFYTTRFPGRGLGLAKVLARLTAIGGLAEAETRPGAGSTVRLLFPVRAEAANAVEPTLVTSTTR